MGEWRPFVRVVAAHDFARCQAIGAWPLREMLLAYLEQAREWLREDLRHRQLLYQIRVALGGAKDAKVPEVPKLLRGPEA